ncbi:hypothetical protein [Solimonas marina]|uniref:EfeO-type cupredoxin-like domain-containing protein n=1 Tax=Solimonas marina TaxID=2714601 RepID=A0A969WGV9_9GAMM|nr:hypothetical protein [Solimonas marina]NKF24450.1 hypothetical protein [Solimonas marina]
MRFTILIALAGGLLAGLWLGLRPPPAAAPAALAGAEMPPATADSDQAATAPAAESVRHFTLQPRPVGATLPVLSVQLGDSVELQVTAPHDDELHVHGYDLSLTLRAGVPATLRFEAAHAGRFDLELHHAAHGELAVLEVHPR